MQDISKKLHQKAVFHICRNENTNGSLVDEVLHFVYDHLCKRTGCQINYEAFVSHVIYDDRVTRVKINVASEIQSDTTTGEQHRWAVRIRVPDASASQRLWFIHIGIHTFANNERVHLFYAELYADCNYGFLSSTPAPAKQCAEFVLDIAQSKSFECLVGDYRLPCYPLQMDSTMVSAFLDLLFSKHREIPIVLTVCISDMVDVFRMAEVLTGNAVVFCIDSINTLDHLNTHLPNTLRAQEDGIHIYSVPNMAGETWVTPIPIHRLLALDDPSKITQVLRRAFCEHLQQDERKNCYDFFEIMRSRETKRLQYLETQLAASQAERDALRVQVKKISPKKLADKSIEGDVKAYEELLEYSTKQMDGCRAQIREISKALYDGADSHELLSGIPINEDIGYLVGAIKHRDFLYTGQRKKA